MKKRISILVAMIMILTSVIGGMALIFANEDLPKESTRERIFGDNRYETAYEIAKARYEQMDTIIIVRGDENGGIPQVADALAASGLAGALEAPILLAHNQRLTGVTTDAIKEMNPSKAVVVGGEQALSTDVVEELQELGLAVERIFGNNRYESAVEVAKKANRNVATAIIVNGYALVDSLVAGPYSHQTGYPILLVQQDRIPGATEAVLSDYDKFIIVGQEGVVSSGVEEELESYGSVERVGGENREETSVLFAERFMGESQKPSVVNGRNYADAVAASILEEAILYLDLRYDRNMDHQMNTAARNILQAKEILRIIGGNAVISDSVFEPVHKEDDSKEPELPETKDTVNKNKTHVFLAPHPDDEVLSMGAGIIDLVEKGKKVHVVLLTAGEGSSIIGNVNQKLQEDGLEDIDIDAFVRSRILEFKEAMKYLGVPKSNYYIHRLPDGGVKAAEVLPIIDSYQEKLNPQQFHAISITDQHRDHKNTAMALKERYNDGSINQPLFYLSTEDYETLSYERIINLSQSGKRKLNKASHAYNRWEPNKGRYAVGWISVKELFLRTLQYNQNRVY